MNRGAASILLGIVLGVCLLMASGAQAATLVGDYQLQGTRASSGPGPALTDLGAGNTFQTDSVMGTSRQVLAFPQDNGVQMSPAGLGGPLTPYSVVTTFRLDTVMNYRRILDFENGASDNGLYTFDGTIDYFAGGDNQSAGTPLSAGTYATLAFVNGGFPNPLRVDVNGVQQLSFAGSADVVADTLRFFKDNTSGGTPNEDSAGAVSCIRVFDGALSDAEIAAIGASPDCTPPASIPAPAPPAKKKKCKKHKKKHRSAESAKKKCKKKRKR
jgi:hypothetical protein